MTHLLRFTCASCRKQSTGHLRQVGVNCVVVVLARGDGERYEPGELSHLGAASCRIRSLRVVYSAQATIQSTGLLVHEMSM